MRESRKQVENNAQVLFSGKTFFNKKHLLTKTSSNKTFSNKKHIFERKTFLTKTFL